MSYGDIIRDAFWIAWRNRFMWFFGFFLSGAAGSFVYPRNFGSLGTQRTDGVAYGPRFPGQLRWASENILLFAILAAVLVLVVVTIWLTLSVISRGALAEGVAAIDRGEERTFSSTWRAGIAYFWRVAVQVTVIFLIWAGIALVIALLGALLVVGTFAATDSIAARVLVVAVGTVLLLPLVVVISVVLGIVGQFALRALVVGGEGVVASIGSGYRLFRRHIGRSLLLLLIQIGISLGAGGAVFAALTVAGLVVSVPVTILSSSGQSVVSAVVGVVLALLLSLPFIVLSSAVGVFHQAYWTLAYLRLTGPPEDTQPARQAGAA